MSWDKPSDELTEYLEEALSGYHFDKKRMFGSQVYFVNGNMFAGVFEATIFLRFAENDREQLLSLSDEIVLFEPNPGQKLKEYIVFNDSFIHDRMFFSNWLDKSYRYASSLPEKKPKSKKPKK